MYEITTYNKESISALKNPALKKSLNTMLTASHSGCTALWKFAKAVHEIITKESFADDFESQTAFAKFVDLSKSTITTYVKAVEFIIREDVQEYFQSDVANVSVGKAYMMSCLEDSELKYLFEFLTDEEVNILDMSDKQLKDMLKQLFKEEEAEEKVVESTQTDADGKAAETEAEADKENAFEPDTAEVNTHPILTAVIKHKNMVITITGKTFNKERIIPLDDELIESIKADYGIIL